MLSHFFSKLIICVIVTTKYSIKTISSEKSLFDPQFWDTQPYGAHCRDMPGHRMGPVTLRVVHSTLISLVWVIPHRYTQRLISMESLNFIKWEIKINHYIIHF